ncbi:hypothetical protein [Legionella sp. PC997]|uniref:hypothetical protein n=1 Tax=Legionella sp. PC997 TaxID=2755562 RepID=UPI0015FC64F2|nr:hypothetical protein [Legionella sp. PC997]QMT61225.1 hypothetical protein HBNCFIEN_02620 [Legionella sp. PC997]
MSIKKQCIMLWFCCFNLFNISYAALYDPTKPIISPLVHETTMDESEFNLQSILIGPMRRLAMINGQIVGTGSSIQGARVLAIDKNHVVLFYAGHRKILYLFGKRLWKTH